MRKCRNCKNRCWQSWSGIEYCINYEMTESEQDEMMLATECKGYEEGTPECIEYRMGYTSATSGDYSPSNPWNAPGMSIKDFI